MVIGIVAVLVVAAIAGAFFLGRGGGDEKASTGTTPTATQTTPTQTQAQTETVVTVTVPAETPPAEEAPEPPATAAVEIVEQSINPANVGRGGPIAITVRTKGDVLGVKMDINGPQPMNVDLNRGPTVNGITTWALATNAPGVVGLYRYSAKASAAGGSTVEAPISTFTVVP